MEGDRVASGSRDRGDSQHSEFEGEHDHHVRSCMTEHCINGVSEQEDIEECRDNERDGQSGMK